MKKFISAILVIMLLSVSASAMSPFEKRGHVVVLTYHLLSETPAEWSEYCISPSAFEQDLIYIKNQGYEFVTASQLAGQDISGRKIAVLTFDDGYSSDLRYAVPLLEKYGACATFFVFGGGVNTAGYLSEADLKSLSERPCAEIGNHSYKLHSLSMSTLSIMYRGGRNNADILADYEKNDSFLESITGKKPTALSYPNGVYTQYIDSTLKKAGKLVTFSTDEVSYRGIEKTTAVGRKNRGCFADIKKLLK